MSSPPHCPIPMEKSIQCLNQYCQSLPVFEFPVYHYTCHDKAFIATLTLPAYLTLDPIESDPFPSKAKAKASVAYLACQELFTRGNFTTPFLRTVLPSPPTSISSSSSAASSSSSTSSSHIQKLHNFCSIISKNIVPQYDFLVTVDGQYSATLRFPQAVTDKYDFAADQSFSSEAVASKKRAKAVAALKACQFLQEQSILDDNLLVIEKELCINVPVPERPELELDEEEEHDEEEFVFHIPTSNFRLDLSCSLRCLHEFFQQAASHTKSPIALPQYTLHKVNKKFAASVTFPNGFVDPEIVKTGHQGPVMRSKAFAKAGIAFQLMKKLHERGHVDDKLQYFSQRSTLKRPVSTEAEDESPPKRTKLDVVRSTKAFQQLDLPELGESRQYPIPPTDAARLKLTQLSNAKSSEYYLYVLSDPKYSFGILTCTNFPYAEFPPLETISCLSPFGKLAISLEKKKVVTFTREQWRKIVEYYVKLVKLVYSGPEAFANVTRTSAPELLPPEADKGYILAPIADDAIDFHEIDRVLSLAPLRAMDIQTCDPQEQTLDLLITPKDRYHTIYQCLGRTEKTIPMLIEELKQSQVNQTLATRASSSQDAGATEKVKASSEEKAKASSEEKAKASSEEKAKPSSEEKAKASSEEKAKASSEEKAKASSEEKAKPSSEEKAKASSEDKAKASSDVAKEDPEWQLFRNRKDCRSRPILGRWYQYPELTAADQTQYVANCVQFPGFRALFRHAVAEQVVESTWTKATKKALMAKPRYLVPEYCQVLPFTASTYAHALELFPLLYNFEGVCQSLHLRSLVAEFYASGLASGRSLAYTTPPDLLQLLNSVDLAVLREAIKKPDYERLEIVGDSFLKLETSWYLFTQPEQASELQMTLLRQEIVRNNRLQEIVGRKKLHMFLQVPQCVGAGVHQYWRPPGHTGPMHSVSVSAKSIADILESIVAAFVIAGGEVAGRQFLDWVGIPVPGKSTDVCAYFPGHYALIATKEDAAFALREGQALEKALGYKFRNPELLQEALTHPTAAARGKSYERMEYLGDAIIDYLLLLYGFQKHPTWNQAQLSCWKSIAVANFTLSYAALVDLKIHHVMTHEIAGYPKLLAEIEKFTASTRANTDEIEDEIAALELFESDTPATSELALPSEWTCPKVFADVFEAVVAAVFLDSNYDLQVVRTCFLPLILKAIAAITRNLTQANSSS